jgi:hypothetical protein
MKTAIMQELIEYLNKDFDWFVKNSPEHGVIPQIIKKATELDAKYASSVNGREWIKVEDVCFYHYMKNLIKQMLKLQNCLLILNSNPHPD